MNRSSQEITGAADPQVSKPATIAAFAGIASLVSLILFTGVARVYEPANTIMLSIKHWLT